MAEATVTYGKQFNLGNYEHEYIEVKIHIKTEEVKLETGLKRAREEVIKIHAVNKGEQK